MNPRALLSLLAAVGVLGGTQNAVGPTILDPIGGF